MKPIGIITDSHCGISQEQADELGVKILPMPFYINETCYYENVSLTREQFFKEQADGSNITTSQPVPADVLKIWDEALLEYNQILYMPISSGLSGSYATACTLAQDEPYEGRVFVVDHGRVSTPLTSYILDTIELIRDGYSAAQIRQILENSRQNMVIYIAVETLEYLKKGGRITPTAAVLASILNIKPILKLDVGKLDLFKKCRGSHKARKLMIDTIKEDLSTRFRDFYENDAYTIVAASSASPEVTASWVQEIEEAFPGKKIISGELSMGICCHIGPGGLGIGCCCKPVRPAGNT